MGALGKSLIMAGLLLMVCGAIIMSAGKIPWLGKLPGDIIIQKNNATFYFPVMSCLLVSLIVSIIMRLFSR